MKKISNWLFRKDLELNKRWWHRFIKVLYFLIFGIVFSGFLTAIFFYPENDYFFDHNVNKISLNQYSKNYTDDERDNTLYKFIKNPYQKDFGVIENGVLKDKSLYLTEYSFGKGSFCLKNPKEYIEWIKKVVADRVEEDINKGLYKKEERNKIEEDIQKLFDNDTERRCVLFLEGNELKDLKKPEHSIVMLEPNIFYYVELVLGLSIIFLMVWFISALTYYKLILYIVYGNKK